jgi:hypothetical protein
MTLGLFHFKTFADITTGLADRNSTFGIFMFVDNNPQIQPTSTLLEIQNLHSQDQRVRSALIQSVIDSVLGLSQFFSSSLQDDSNFNLQMQSMKVINLFTENLKKNISQIQVQRKQTFQLMIAPTLTDKLVARSLDAPKIIPTYPMDRPLIYDILPDQDDSYASAERIMNTKVYRGIVSQLRNHYENQKTDQPHFLSMSITLELDPNKELSNIRSELLLAMPTNIQKDFKNENDQVRFSQIVFPDFKITAGKDFLFSAQNFPILIANMNQKVFGTESKLILQFGPLGTYTDGQWRRIPGNNFVHLVPKIRGTLKKTGAVGQLAQAIQVDFNIFNVEADIATQQVSNIDLYISAGVRSAPNLKFGRINNKTIDSQFVTEINKTIQQQAHQIESHIQQGQEQLSLAQSLMSTIMEKKR